MKVNRLEAHDRYLHLLKDQSASLSQGADDCLKKNSLSLALQKRSPYIYIFAHPRTHEDGVTKVMIWQPRLEKPKAQTNSYLFRAQSHSDVMEVCWMLPPREMWKQYQKGNVTESDWTCWSINQFQKHRQELEKPFPDDLSKDKIKNIYLDIAREIEQQAMLNKSKTTLMDGLYLND